MAFNIIKHRRGTTQEWLALDSVLIPEEGELVIEECSDGVRKCKIGTGKAKFSELLYINDELKAELLAELEALGISFESKLNTTEESILEQVNTIRRALTDDIVTSTNSVINQFTQADAAVKTDLTAQVVEAKKSIRAEHAADFAELSSDIDVKTGQLEERVLGHVKTETDRLEATITKVNVDTINNLNKNITDAVSPIASGLSDETSLRTRQFEELTSELDTVEKTITEEVQPMLKNLGEKLDSSIESLAKEHTNDIEAIAGDLLTRTAVLDNKICASPQNIIDNCVFILYSFFPREKRLYIIVGMILCLQYV